MAAERFGYTVTTRGKDGENNTKFIKLKKTKIDLDIASINPGRNRAVELARLMGCKIHTAAEAKGIKMAKDKTERGVRKANPVTEEIKALIRKGKSNEEIWETVKGKYKLDDGKKHYPGWYRSSMKSKGEDYPNPGGRAKKADKKTEKKTTTKKDKPAAKKDKAAPAKKAATKKAAPAEKKKF